MRDPERIPVVLAALKEYWSKHPDLRLGQIVSNMTLAGLGGPSIFNIEDDALLGRLLHCIHLPPSKPPKKP